MYSTTSMGEAAYLLSKGFEVQQIADNRATRVKTYIFDKEAAQVVQGYYNDEPLPVRSFHMSLQAARRLIRD